MDLVMDSVMMKPTMLPVIMIMETAVWLILLQIIAQIALVIYLRLVLLEFIHQLEMAIAMMLPIFNNAILMAETAVDPVSLLIYARTVLALVM